MSRKIAWEKWDEAEFLQDDHPEPEKPEDLTFSSFEEEEIPNLEAQMFGIGGFPAPKVRTPLGVFSIDDPMRPSSMFDCWVGHTNFDITNGLCAKIEEVPGIEAFRVISRYRFFIGVAKLFSFRDVREEIQKSLDTNSETVSNYQDEEILGLIQSQLMDSKRWAIFYSKDGFIDYIMTDEDNDQEYDIKLAKFTKDKDFTVIKSEDVA
jgi:hypothetical protein